MRRSNARRISTLIPARTRIQLFAMIRDGEPKRAHHSFAPLAGLVNKSGEDEYMKLQGIVFDMDGTLCEPQNYMFAEMRSAVGIPQHVDILDHIHALPDKQQTDAFAKIQAIEREAMANQVPQPGLVALMEYLDLKGIEKAICTRNFDTPVLHFLENFVPTNVRPFSPVVTREFRPPKPSPAGILHIAKQWAVFPANTTSVTQINTPPTLPLVMVGDSVDDMTAGREAGALTVLLRSQGKEELEKDERTDVVVDRLDELVEHLEQGLVSKATTLGNARPSL